MADSTQIVPGWEPLLNRYGLLGYEKQLRVQQWLGRKLNSDDELLSTLDHERGELCVRAGEDDPYPESWPMQVLATVDAATDVWRWAWADAANPTSGSDAKLVRQTAQTLGLAELTTPEIALGGMNPHLVALTAAGAAPLDAYYRVPHPGGATFVSLRSAELRERVGGPTGRMLYVVPQALMGLPVLNHRRALLVYAEALDLTLEPAGGRPHLTETFEQLRDARKPAAPAEPSPSVDRLVAVDNDGTPIVSVEFDRWGRLLVLEGLVGDTRMVTPRRPSPPSRLSPPHLPV